MSETSEIKRYTCKKMGDVSMAECYQCSKNLGHKILSRAVCQQENVVVIHKE